jgi:hypothetical protein
LILYLPVSAIHIYQIFLAIDVLQPICHLGYGCEKFWGLGRRKRMHRQYISQNSNLYILSPTTLSTSRGTTRRGGRGGVAAEESLNHVEGRGGVAAERSSNHVVAIRSMLVAKW